MSDLIDKLKAKLEYKDLNLSWEEEEALDPSDRACLHGQYLEASRRRAVDEALCEIVNACIETSRTIVNPISMTDARMQLSQIESKIDNALRKLRAALESNKG